MTTDEIRDKCNYIPCFGPRDHNATSTHVDVLNCISDLALMLGQLQAQVRRQNDFISAVYRDYGIRQGIHPDDIVLP